MTANTESASAPPASREQTRREIAPVETIHEDDIRTALDVLAEDPAWRSIWRFLLSPFDESQVIQSRN